MCLLYVQGQQFATTPLPFSRTILLPSPLFSSPFPSLSPIFVPYPHPLCLWGKYMSFVLRTWSSGVLGSTFSISLACAEKHRERSEVPASRAYKTRASGDKAGRMQQEDSLPWGCEWRKGTKIQTTEPCDCHQFQLASEPANLV